jgi:dTDP-4-amino-4,6-dideoxy-D-galactose acyltransferase
MNPFEILALDTEIFGFPVARIIPDRMTPGELDQVISCLKREGVRLIFWASDPNDKESQRAARLRQGFLADQKVTFVVDLAETPERPAGVAWNIEEYADRLPSAELENLAIQVGRNSRFGADSRIPVEKYCALYKRWIRNSVNGQVADAVLVVRRAGKVVGMATVGGKGERGFIGLFAVDSAMRGKNVGVSMVHAAQAWIRRKGFRFAQVVTQKENIAACKLYEKCGYEIEKVEYFYHFWI